MQKSTSVHAALMEMYADDRRSNPSQVWQCKGSLGRDWYDLHFPPAWLPGSFYRRKPAPTMDRHERDSTDIPEVHRDTYVEWRNSPQFEIWQATRKDGTWFDLSPMTQPKWYKSRQYRRKPPTLGVCGSEYHIALQQQWKDDQSRNPPLRWQFRNKSYNSTNAPWTDDHEDKGFSWYADKEYRRIPPVVGVYGSRFHTDLQQDFMDDKDNDPSRVWQYRQVGSQVWFDYKVCSPSPFSWYSDYEYRRKPVADVPATTMPPVATTEDVPDLTHPADRLKWASDQVSNPDQLWQATRKNGTWMNIPKGTEPKWYKSRQYRRADSVDSGLNGLAKSGVPECHKEAWIKWVIDQVANPDQVWQYADKEAWAKWVAGQVGNPGGSGVYVDIPNGVSPRWCENTIYRRKPTMYRYGLVIHKVTKHITIGVSTGGTMQEHLDSVASEGCELLDQVREVEVPA